MSVQYITREGDMVDQIAFSYYGITDGTTEAVLEANPGLANFDVLPAGIQIQLPPAPTKEQAQIKLWS